MSGRPGADASRPGRLGTRRHSRPGPGGVGRGGGGQGWETGEAQESRGKGPG